MRELIYNLQPTIWVLIGIAVLFVFPQRIDKEKAQALFKKPRWYIRMIPGVILALAISFAVSFMYTIIFAPSSGFMIVNAVCIFILIILYEVKLLRAAKKVVKN